VGKGCAFVSGLFWYMNIAMMSQTLFRLPCINHKLHFGRQYTNSTKDIEILIYPITKRRAPGTGPGDERDTMPAGTAL
jgi:hypothetical protein